MRDLANEERILELFKQLGRRIRTNVRVYLTGGATAVLIGWRDATVDVDLKFEPEIDEFFRALPELKEQLRLNIELAAPSDFIPPVPGWAERSRFIVQEGKVSFYHYDLYSQALSKIERGHDQDLRDVEAMFERGVIERPKLLELFEAIKPELYRYPAIDPPSFAEVVEEIAGRKPK